ncbi:glycosyltransferase family 4 protein [Henriciella marina]|uniref:glycosyltransferase family 4 protein n=1 Tax=Henriciella marina TaxID=453851 RepID=UPI0003808BB3|nr:glycosyltransferase family 4 protein [Henriciella marina]
MTVTALPDLSGRTILQVIPELSAGGAERTTLEVAEAIIEAGGRAIVASEGGRLVSALEAAGGEHVDLGLSTKNPVAVISNAGKLASLIEDQGIDLVHARSRAPAWSALWAARRTGTAFVTTYHGAYSGRSALKKVYNSVMARGDVVIANSEWTADHVQTVHGVQGARLVTIPRGVDFDVFDAGLVTSERVDAIRQAWQLEAANPTLLLLPGRLTSWKGQLVAINAFSKLDESLRAGAILILAGDAQGRDKYREELEKAIAALGLEHAVRIVGHTEDMAAAYAASDIVLAPSIRPEAFGRVAAEASAMGKPVIAADHGGQREIIVDRKTGLRVEPGNPSSLATAIGALLALEAPERQALGEAGRLYVKDRFSKRGLQAATLSVYERVFDAREEPLS